MLSVEPDAGLSPMTLDHDLRQNQESDNQPRVRRSTNWATQAPVHNIYILNRAQLIFTKKIKPPKGRSTETPK